MTACAIKIAGSLSRKVIVGAHLMLRTIVPCVVLLDGTRYFFPTVYVDRVTCSLILQYFLGQSGTKKESGRSRPLERTLHSQLRERVSSLDLCGNYAKLYLDILNDSINSLYITAAYTRKHARACSVHCAGGGGPDKIMHTFFIRRCSRPTVCRRAD